MLVHLKIKIKALAAEAVIIRHAERQWRKRDRDTFVSLQLHRQLAVRREARSSLLAYAFLRGRAYRSIEPKCYQKPNWAWVERIAKRFGPERPDLKDALKAWAETASQEATRRVTTGAEA